MDIVIILLGLFGFVVGAALFLVFGGSFRNGGTSRMIRGGWGRSGRRTAGVAIALILVSALWILAGTLIVGGLVLAAI